MNKKGDTFGIVTSIVIVAIVLLGVLGVFSSGISTTIDRAPDQIANVLNGIFKIITPVASLLYAAVAPSGSSDNAKAIAFSVFLLIVLVGYTGISGFFKKPVALAISVIVGIIASRGLTDTVFEQAAISASPIATASLIIGFLPIFALTKNIRKWRFTHATNVMIYGICALVYLIMFWAIFKSPLLGITYAVAIVLMAITEIIKPKVLQSKEERDIQRAAAAARRLHQDVRVARAIAAPPQQVRPGDLPAGYES